MHYARRLERFAVIGHGPSATAQGKLRRGASSFILPPSSFSSVPRLPVAAMNPFVRKAIARTIRGPARRIDLPMRFYDRRFAFDLADALPEIADELVAGLELVLRRHVAIVVADEADAEGDVIEVIAVH